MQVVSGTMGKERVHFEAPPSHTIAQEMKRFLYWFNEAGPGAVNEIKKGPIRAAIAHLYFESIHPFEDGNGRIGRAIAEKALSQAAGHPVLLSLSLSIEAKKKEYYKALEKAQSSHDITPWMEYFLDTNSAAQIASEAQIHFIVAKAHFFDLHTNKLNKRQLQVIQPMFEEGAKGFIGGMSAKKYMAIAKTSKATATRDLQMLGLWNLLELAEARGMSW